MWAIRLRLPVRSASQVRRRLVPSYRGISSSAQRNARTPHDKRRRGGRRDRWRFCIAYIAALTRTAPAKAPVRNALCYPFQAAQREYGEQPVFQYSLTLQPPFSLRPVGAIGIGEISVWELFHDAPIGLRPRLLAEVVAVRIGGTRFLCLASWFAEISRAVGREI